MKKLISLVCKNTKYLISSFFIVYLSGCSNSSEINYLTDLNSSEYDLVEVKNINLYEREFAPIIPSEYILEYFVCGGVSCTRYRSEVKNENIVRFCVYNNEGLCVADSRGRQFGIRDLLKISSDEEKLCEFEVNRSIGLPVSFSCSGRHVDANEHHAPSEKIKIVLFGSKNIDYRDLINYSQHECIFGEWVNGSDSNQSRVVFFENGKFEMFDSNNNKPHSLGFFSVESDTYPFKVRMINENEEIYSGLYKCRDNLLKMIVWGGQMWPTELDENAVGFSVFRPVD